MIRRILRSLLVITLFGLALVVLGTVVPRPFQSPPHSDTESRHRILVLFNPIHTDIALPLDDAVRAEFGFMREAGLPIDAPGARYLVFGRGSRGFYTQTPTWSELRLIPLLKGLTLDRAAMHVEVSGEIAEPQSFILGFDVGDAELSAIIAHVAASFARGPDGPLVIDGISYGRNDTFYEANGYFTALLGCNVWAAGALRASGLRTGWWNPLPVTLAYSLSLFN